MHRTATFYDLKISSRGISRSREHATEFEATPKPMTEIASHIKQLHEGGDRIVKKGRSEKSASYYLSDIQTHESRLVMLINKSDPTAPDSVSTDPDSKSRVVHEKPPRHGSDFSAHVVINLNPVVGDNYYLCVIETVFRSGLHASSIEDYLRFIFRHCRKQFPEKYLTPHNSGARTADGMPVMVRHVHDAEFQGHPSKEFEDDIEGGTISGIELLNFSKVGAVWDEAGAIIEQKRSIVLRPERTLLSSASSTIKQVRNKISKNREEYKHIRLRFKTDKGEPKGATIDSDTGKLIDSHKYVKRHQISAPLVNTTSLEQINKFILREILKLME